MTRRLAEYYKQELQELLGKPSQNCTGDWAGFASPRHS
jgi:hypothetical protein